MDLMFNELSLQPPAAGKPEAYSRVTQLLETFKANQKHGFNRIRFEQHFHEMHLYANYTLHDYCTEPRNRTQQSLLLGLRRYPYLEEDSVAEEQYLGQKYFIDKAGTLLPCQGLAAACLLATAGIGFAPEPFWESIQFELVITNGETNREPVYCLSSPTQADHHSFKTWLENKGVIQLRETSLAAGEKKIHLRDDHGQDQLQAFAGKIIQSPYVVSVINSLPFNPQARNFIKKINPDGSLELVLTGTDSGLGLIIQTTGRNLRETTEIAARLERKYKA